MFLNNRKSKIQLDASNLHWCIVVGSVSLVGRKEKDLDKIWTVWWNDDMHVSSRIHVCSDMHENDAHIINI